MTIWWPEIPVWEVLFRAVFTFFFLLIALRMTGKRDVGEMSPSDFILLLLLSANLHTSISGDDKSILGGILGACSLILVNFTMNRFATKSKRFEKLLKGTPEIIIHNGKEKRDVMKRHQLSDMQLLMALRKEQAETYDQVRLAVLEPDGEITVFKFEESSQLSRGLATERSLTTHQ